MSSNNDVNRFGGGGVQPARAAPLKTTKYLNTKKILWWTLFTPFLPALLFPKILVINILNILARKESW